MPHPTTSTQDNPKPTLMLGDVLTSEMTRKQEPIFKNGAPMRCFSAKSGSKCSQYAGFIDLTSHAHAAQPL